MGEPAVLEETSTTRTAWQRVWHLWECPYLHLLLLRNLQILRNHLIHLNHRLVSQVGHQLDLLSRIRMSAH